MWQPISKYDFLQRPISHKHFFSYQKICYNILQVQLDVSDKELNKLEVEVALTKFEVIATRMKAKDEVVVAQSEVARAKTEVKESRKEGYQGALFDVRATFPELDLSCFGFLKESQAELWFCMVA